MTTNITCHQKALRTTMTSGFQTTVKEKIRKGSKDSIQIRGQQVTILSCQNITIMSRLNSCSWDMPEPLGVLDYK